MKLYKKAACKNTSSLLFKKKSIPFLIKENIESYFPQRPKNGTVVLYFNTYNSKFKGSYP